MTKEKELILKQDLVFIDTETTGLYPSDDRVIEVGLVRVKNGEIVDEYNTLINPRRQITNEITKITGITQEDVSESPTFSEVKDELFSKLSNAVFVAHNADFDYDFIEQEFLRVDQTFSVAKLCTVKLSRLMYSNLLNYKLDTLIRMLNLEVENRHRAMDDAVAMFELYRHMKENFPKNKLDKAILKVIEEPKVRRIPNSSQSGGDFCFIGKVTDDERAVLEEINLLLREPNGSRYDSDLIWEVIEVHFGYLGIPPKEALTLIQSKILGIHSKIIYEG